MVSGNNTPDKFAKSKLTTTKSNLVEAPIINELPICLECEFLKFQDDEYSYGVIAKVVNVSCEESAMQDDKVDINALEAIAFDPYTHGYYKVSERVGNAFKDGLELR